VETLEHAKKLVGVGHVKPGPIVLQKIDGFAILLGLAKRAFEKGVVGSELR
jgi:hypothetical protein